MALFIGCKDADESSSSDDTTTESSGTESGTDDGTITVTSENETFSASGYILDGPCLAGADVYIYPLNSVTLAQTGDKYQGVTTDNFGSYSVPTSINTTTNPYAEVFTDAACHNEVTGQVMTEKTYRAIVDWKAAEANNVNPHTTATVPRITELFTNAALTSTYGDMDASRAQAESEYMSEVYNITGITTSFTDMDLTTVSDANAAHLAMSAIHLYGLSEAEQTALITSIAYDLEDDGDIDDTDITDTISANSQALDMQQTKTFHVARYAKLGSTIDPIHFWEFIDSDFDGTLNGDDSHPSVDLLSRTPTVLYALNDDVTGTNGFDTDDNKFFAFPFIPTETISFSYIAVNVDGNRISLYTNVGDSPGVLLIASDHHGDYLDSSLDDVGLTSYPVPSGVHAAMSYTMLEDTEYFIVIEGDVNYRPSMGSPSGLLPFGRNLHSVDGITWIGNGGCCTAPFFSANKIKALFLN